MQPNEGGERCRGTATPVKDAGASDQPPPPATPPRGPTALMGLVGRGIRPNLHDNCPILFSIGSILRFLNLSHSRGLAFIGATTACWTYFLD